jgi:hypothetical protein
VTDATDRAGVALLWLHLIEDRVLAEHGPAAGLAKAGEGVPQNRSGPPAVSVTNGDGRDSLGDGCG